MWIPGWVTQDSLYNVFRRLSVELASGAHTWPSDILKYFGRCEKDPKERAVLETVGGFAVDAIVNLFLSVGSMSKAGSAEEMSHMRSLCVRKASAWIHFPLAEVIMRGGGIAKGLLSARGLNNSAFFVQSRRVVV